MEAANLPLQFSQLRVCLTFMKGHIDLWYVGIKWPLSTLRYPMETVSKKLRWNLPAKLSKERRTESGRNWTQHEEDPECVLLSKSLQKLSWHDQCCSHQFWVFFHTPKGILWSTRQIRKLTWHTRPVAWQASRSNLLTPERNGIESRTMKPTLPFSREQFSSLRLRYISRVVLASAHLESW